MLLVGGMLTACGGEKDLYEGPNNGNGNQAKELQPESAYLDFSTTTNVGFKLDYGKLGQRVLVQIFTENPLVFDATEGYATIKGEPYYKIFTDDNGLFEGNVDLPAGTETVFVYTDALGVKRFAELSVSNGKVTADLTNRPKTASQLRTRATGHQIWDLGQVGVFPHLYSIVNWEGNAYGQITNDNGGLLTEGTFTAEDLKIIKPLLGNEKTSTFSNSKHWASTELVNAAIAPTFVNENGETVTTTSAQVYVTYVGEMGAWYQDGLGYYFYKNGEAPATRAEALANLKHYVILPNSSLPADAPFLGSNVGMYRNDYYNYGEENAPAWSNERIQLLFEDPETGEITTQFPPGYTIGFFQVSKADWKINSNTDATYKMGTRVLWYSNKEWNSDNRSHFSALGYKDKILYGCEDGINTSYNDLVFSVEADPTGVIKNPEREEIEIVVPEDDVTEYSQKTYAFEDIWPTGGDYDLNDVIVEHRRAVTFDAYNYVKEVVDSFMAVQPAGSAEYNDGFAIQIPANQRGTLTLPAGAVDETETNSIIIFKSAKQVRGQWFVVKRTFTGKELTKPGLEKEDNNPFIIANYSTDENRTEVHLPKHKATAKANAAQIGADDDAYYTNKDGKHPFSLMLPLGGNRPFQAVTEQVAIELEYADYETWVQSKMTQKQDWYLNYQKKQ
jgi:LruC domain-containing protein